MRLKTGPQGQVRLKDDPRVCNRRAESRLPQQCWGLAAHLHPDPVVHAQPEEQQGAQEHRLEEVIQHPWEPAVHQEGQREEGVWKAEAEEPDAGRLARAQQGRPARARAELATAFPSTVRAKGKVGNQTNQKPVNRLLQ